MLGEKITGFFCPTGYKLPNGQKHCPVCGQTSVTGEIITVPDEENPNDKKMMVKFNSGEQIPYKLTHR
jgi:hypothetical protein